MFAFQTVHTIEGNTSGHFAHIHILAEICLNSLKTDKETTLSSNRDEYQGKLGILKVIHKKISSWWSSRLLKLPTLSSDVDCVESLKVYLNSPQCNSQPNLELLYILLTNRICMPIYTSHFSDSDDWTLVNTL